MKTNLILKVLVLWLGTFSVANAQSGAGFIYGDIQTIDGEKYTGVMRWGKEEAFWDDLFNATKKSNKAIEYVSSDNMKYVLNRSDNDKWNWEFMSLWENKMSGFSHQFVLRFGDISKIRMIDRDEAEVTYRNGEKIRVSDGNSNDIGAKIRIFDPELGETNLDWDRIETIEFKEMPGTYDKKFGDPLYGKVLTTKGEMQGFIQWDHEECLSTDKLDGESNNGKMSIEFGNLKSITNLGNSVKVVLKSGRTFDLDGSNDVNDDNRGVIVKNPEWGKVLIQWDEFKSLEFFDKAPEGEKFKDFISQGPLKGTVKTKDGQSLSGRLIYDIDEALTCELLDGKTNGLEYSIPFSKIKSIRVKNYEYSSIELRSGKKLLLNGSQDVTDQNDGILVFVKENDDPTYIPWEKVEEVIFN